MGNSNPSTKLPFSLLKCFSFKDFFTTHKLQQTWIITFEVIIFQYVNILVPELTHYIFADGRSHFHWFRKIISPKTNKTRTSCKANKPRCFHGKLAMPADPPLSARISRIHGVSSSMVTRYPGLTQWVLSLLHCLNESQKLWPIVILHVQKVKVNRNLQKGSSDVRDVEGTSKLNQNINASWCSSPSQRLKQYKSVKVKSWDSKTCNLVVPVPWSHQEGEKYGQPLSH